MTGWFVTGTDTGVGKTVVSAAVCAARRASGRRVVYVKPAQSGAADGDDDAADVAALAGVPTVTGAVLGEALAPAVAARRLGAGLTGTELAGVVSDALADHRPDEVVVEGAGGLLVELGTDGTTCADLASMLDLQVLVVARPGLGTLNHTALTLEALARRELTLAGVVVNGFPADPDLAARTNGEELDRLAGGRLLGVVPALARLGVDDAPTWLAPDLGGTWDRATWLESLR